VFLVIIVCACQNDELISNDAILSLRHDTGIAFNNQLIYNDSINPYTYRNFYNGSGLAIGDLDNDGLDDIFFTGNQVDNQLYKNLGDFRFEEVTSKSQIASKNSWCTGATMVDINGDNLLDIYVCKAGPPSDTNRKNQLFINQGDFQFTDEAAKYGLDVKGLSIQASFFDFDRDGDLDCYLLNNSLKSVGGYDLREGQRDKAGENGNKFFENIDGKFVDKTTELGIYSSAIGFGLGVMVLDLNGDNYPDIYVANDFFEKDYVYINQQGKGFLEKGEKYFDGFPLGSMGLDAADINNDLRPDIFVAEMLPATLERRKTKAIFDTWEKHQNSFKKGYYYQYPRNMFYLNQYPQKNIELGRLHNLTGTEWSWSPLIFDIDNDGNRDLFVSNGIGRDLLDRDYLSYMADDQKIARLIREDKNALSELIDLMPESKVQNAIFQNQSGAGFKDVSRVWTDMPPSISNASAYSDLDKDGDLDLVIANVNDKSFVLENNNIRENNWIGFDLEGQQENTKAIGANIFVFTPSKKLVAQQMPSRGFQSSVSQSIHVGLGKDSQVDSVMIQWPDGGISYHNSLALNQYHNVKQDAHVSNENNSFRSIDERLVISIIDSIQVEHSSSIPNDFNNDPLCIAMVAERGPSFCHIDLDRDGLKDWIIGGAKDVATTIVDSEKNQKTILTKRKYSAVVDTYPIDIDEDGDLDLYLAHGTRMFTQYSTELHDILLINNGNGDFNEQPIELNFPHPVMTSSIAFGDLDNNGFDDIFVVERMAKNTYGMPGSGFLFLNQGNKDFKRVESSELEEIGMMTDVKIVDIENDGKLEIIVCGEWMSLKVFRYNDGEIADHTNDYGLLETTGLWNTLEVADLDRDGKLDLIAGNLGQNSVMKEGMQLTVRDFDGNGKPEQIISQKIEGTDYPIHDLDDLAKQLPAVRKKYDNYQSYSTAGMKELFGANIPASVSLDMVETTAFIFKDGKFVKRELPQQAQYSSTHAIAILDVNQDGIKDLVSGGNHYNYKPQYGRDDASSGLVILGKIVDGEYEFGEIFSLGIDGEIRSIVPTSETTVMFGIVNQDIYSYEIKVKDE